MPFQLPIPSPPSWMTGASEAASAEVCELSQGIRPSHIIPLQPSYATWVWACRPRCHPHIIFVAYSCARRSTLSASWSWNRPAQGRGDKLLGHSKEDITLAGRGEPMTQDLYLSWGKTLLEGWGGRFNDEIVGSTIHGVMATGKEGLPENCHELTLQ